MKRLVQFIDRMNTGIARCTFWLMLGMVLIGTYNAIGRKLGQHFGWSITSNGLLEMQWYLFSIIFLLVGAYNLKNDAHVRVDLVYDRLSPEKRAWVNLIGAVLFLLPLAAVCFWSSLDFVTDSWSDAEKSSDPGGLLRYPLKTVIPIAFVMLMLQGLSEILKSIGIIRGKPLEETGVSA
ncbi:MAG: TRAP-type mannitol/chloroaromatic compound transport system permease small subunit [Kiritimatiellia bacterium]|jgi:TRAP-type mannitol/chloroaromatic compound transport system permease small subunit